VLLLPLLLFVLGMYVYPTYLNIRTGFENIGAAQFITHTGTYDGVANYRYLFGSSIFWSALGHTALFAIVTVPLQVVLGFLIALLFNRPGARYSVFRALLLVPWLLPLIVTGTIWIWMLDRFYGVLNWLLYNLGIIPHYIGWVSSIHLALWSVIAANTWVGIPVATLILAAGLRGIPHDLYEAASLDGAGAVRRHLYVTVPLIADVIAIFFLLGFVFSVKIFDIVFIMTAGGPADSSNVLGTLAYQTAFQSNQWGDSASISNVMLVLSLLLALAYVRFTGRRGALSL
jgi:multiple sugar transport system permease protein